MCTLLRNVAFVASEMNCFAPQHAPIKISSRNFLFAAFAMDKDSTSITYTINKLRNSTKVTCPSKTASTKLSNSGGHDATLRLIKQLKKITALCFCYGRPLHTKKIGSPLCCVRDITTVFWGTERLDILSRDRKDGDRTPGTERHGSSATSLR